MNNYVIFADAACDINSKLLEEWGVPCEELTFKFDNSDKIYGNSDISVSDFYAKMKEGRTTKTSAANAEAFMASFEKILSQGTDILYLCFSSALSSTINSARIAANEMSEKYPERKIIVLDTLASSTGIGLLIRLVLDKKEAGATIEEAAEYAKELIPRICHWFTVDDLVYLKRGGRISPAAAFFGNMIGIKPVLHVDDEGHLVPVAKVRGRKTAISAVADKYGELAKDKENGLVYIAHSDCENDAKALAALIHERYGAKVSLISDIGPVIGGHSGPGTLAVFFIGTSR